MTAPTFKKATDTDAGDSTKYGAPDVKYAFDILDATHATDRVQASSIETTGASDVQTDLDLKAPSIGPILTTPQINDTSSDHQYIFAVSELAADRTVTLPLLAGNDTFVFETFAQTLTNKTVALGSNTVSGTLSEFNAACTDDNFMSLGGVETVTGAKTFLDDKLLVQNPATTFEYTIQGGAIVADRVLSLPVITGSDTVAVLAIAQTFTGNNTFSGINIHSGSMLVTGSSTFSAQVNYLKSSGPNMVLQVADSGTTNDERTINIIHQTDGNMAAGFGSNIGFIIDDPGVSNESTGEIGFIRGLSDDDGEFVVKCALAGTLTDRYTIDENGVHNFKSGAVNNFVLALGGTGNAITGTAAEFDTAVTDDNFGYLGAAQTFTAEQTASISDAGTTTSVSAVSIQHITSGNMADGFGAHIDFKIDDAASSIETIGNVGFVRDTGDDSGKFVVQTYAGGFASSVLTISQAGVVDWPSGGAHTNFVFNANGTGNAITNIDVADHSATGSPSSSTFYRGDNTWSTPAGAGDMVLADVQTITGAKTFGTIGGAVGKLILAGSTSGSSIVNAAAAAGSTTLTLPAATDTLVGKATTDTFTNKSIDEDGTGNSITNIDVASIKTGSSLITSSITVVIDGGGSTITTGVKVDITIPFGCTIDSVVMLADQSGSIVVDIFKDTFANYPPLVGDSITASDKPTITTAFKSEDTDLGTWTTSITAGDTLRYNVDSVTDIQRLTISLKITRT